MPTYEHDKAITDNDLGLLLASLDKSNEARTEYEAARDIFAILVKRYPDEPKYQVGLGVTHNNLGVLFAGLRLYEKALAEYKSALVIRESLVKNYSVPWYRADLGFTYFKYGDLICDEGKPAESLEWYDRAVQTLKDIHDLYPGDLPTRQFLRNCYWHRAQAFDKLPKPIEAAKDWERAVDLSPPAEQPGIHASHAYWQSQTGMIVEAIAKAAELTKSSKWNAIQWYDFACVYSIASGKIADKKQEYADRAMELLHKAVKAGYKDAVHMATDSDLDALRDRADFKKLLTEFEKKPDKK